MLLPNNFTLMQYMSLNFLFHVCSGISSKNYCLGTFVHTMSALSNRLVHLGFHIKLSVWSTKGVFVWAFSGFPLKKAIQKNQTGLLCCGLRQSHGRK
jgi:hypothetical protein